MQYTNLKYSFSTNPKRPSNNQLYGDLNYFFSPGTYNCSSNDSKNMPSGETYGTVLVFGANIPNGEENPSSYSWIYQLFFSTSAYGAGIYIRKNINYNYTEWTQWYKFA